MDLEEETVTTLIECDLYRELEKAQDALIAAVRHFDAQATADAALHLAEQIRPNPLAARVGLAAEQIATALVRYKPHIEEEEMEKDDSETESTNPLPR